MSYLLANRKITLPDQTPSKLQHRTTLRHRSIALGTHPCDLALAQFSDARIQQLRLSGKDGSEGEIPTRISPSPNPLTKQSRGCVVSLRNGRLRQLRGNDCLNARRTPKSRYRSKWNERRPSSAENLCSRSPRLISHRIAFARSLSSVRASAAPPLIPRRRLRCNVVDLLMVLEQRPASGTEKKINK